MELIPLDFIPAIMANMPLKTLSLLAQQELHANVLQELLVLIILEVLADRLLLLILQKISVTLLLPTQQTKDTIVLQITLASISAFHQLGLL